MTALCPRLDFMRWTLSLVMAVGFFCGAARAATPGNRGQTIPDKPEKKTVDIPKVDPKAANDAKTALTAAKANQSKAESALNLVVTKLQKSFESSPGVASAIQAERTTQAAYESAQEPLITSLKARPDYKAADAAVVQADQQMQTLRNSTDASPADRTAAAQKLTDAKTVVTHMTTDAVNADPKTTAARTHHADAAVALGKLRKDFDESLKNNAEWVSAKKNLDAARAEMLTAQKNFDAANKELAKQQAAHDAAVRQQQQFDREYANKLAAYNQAVAQANRPPKSKK